MALFFRRIWTFVRPYKTRLLLGLLCGFFYALASGALMVLVKMVVNAVFPGSEHFSLAKQFEQMPQLIPLAQRLAGRLPGFTSPASASGQVLLILSIPALMVLRNTSGYLNVYFTNWAAVRAITIVNPCN